MPYAVMPEVTRGVVKTVFEGFGGGEEELVEHTNVTDVAHCMSRMRERIDMMY